MWFLYIESFHYTAMSVTFQHGGAFKEVDIIIANILLLKYLSSSLENHPVFLQHLAVLPIFSLFLDQRYFRFSHTQLKHFHNIKYLDVICEYFVLTYIV